MSASNLLGRTSYFQEKLLGLISSAGGVTGLTVEPLYPGKHSFGSEGLCVIFSLVVNRHNETRQYFLRITAGTEGRYKVFFGNDSFVMSHHKGFDMKLLEVEGRMAQVINTLQQGSDLGDESSVVLSLKSFDWYVEWESTLHVRINGLYHLLVKWLPNNIATPNPLSSPEKVSIMKSAFRDIDAFADNSSGILFVRTKEGSEEKIKYIRFVGGTPGEPILFDQKVFPGLKDSNIRNLLPGDYVILITTRVRDECHIYLKYFLSNTDNKAYQNDRCFDKNETNLWKDTKDMFFNFVEDADSYEDWIGPLLIKGWYENWKGLSPNMSPA